MPGACCSFDNVIENGFRSGFESLMASHLQTPWAQTLAGFFDVVAQRFCCWIANLRASNDGDPINCPTTREGKYPAWSTARQRYWKNEALNKPVNIHLVTWPG